MQWLIIGSTAACHWFGEQVRIPKDIDLLTPAKITGSESKVCIVDAKWHDAAELIFKLNTDPVFANPNILYTLKVSHAHWNIHWPKTINDIHTFQTLGCTLHKPLYDELVAVWNTIHGVKHVNLNQTVDKFFDDAVTREYDHELLHEIVASPNRPMHERLRPDPNLVWCDVNIFEAFTPAEKARVVHEELLVTAIERGNLILNNPTSKKTAAVHNAYKLLCTSMTKGWFARYLITNYYELLLKQAPVWRSMLEASLTKLKSI